MGENWRTIIIKNGRYIIICLTVFDGFFYMIVHLHTTAINGMTGIFLRLFGIFVVALLAYIPYRIADIVTQHMHYMKLFFGIWSIFFIGDFAVRIMVISRSFPLPGLIGFVLYPFLFVCAMCALWVTDYLLQRCGFKKDRCRLLVLKNKKKLFDLFPKKEKV